MQCEDAMCEVNMNVFFKYLLISKFGRQLYSSFWWRPTSICYFRTIMFLFYMIFQISFPSIVEMTIRTLESDCSSCGTHYVFQIFKFIFCLHCYFFWFLQSESKMYFPLWSIKIHFKCNVCKENFCRTIFTIIFILKSEFIKGIPCNFFDDFWYLKK